jgi:hypothetical protein
MSEHSSDPTTLKGVVALMLLTIVPYLNMGQEISSTAIALLGQMTQGFSASEGQHQDSIS